MIGNERYITKHAIIKLTNTAITEIGIFPTVVRQDINQLPELRLL